MKKIKLTESKLHEIISESIMKHLNEAELGNLECDDNGCRFLNGKQTFDEIDKALSELGDAHVSRFYSDDNNTVIAVNKNDFRNIKNNVEQVLNDFSYKLYDTGADGDYIMMTFKSQPNIGL